MTDYDLVGALNKQDARLFACDCAERVLPLFERDYPNDNRPRKAIEVARRYAVGEATEDERNAACAAAKAAARDADEAAAWHAAWSAAGAAAEVPDSSAERDAAIAPDSSAERDAEGEWQIERLLAILCRDAAL